MYDSFVEAGDNKPLATKPQGAKRFQLARHSFATGSKRLAYFFWTLKLKLERAPKFPSKAKEDEAFMAELSNWSVKNMRSPKQV